MNASPRKDHERSRLAPANVRVRWPELSEEDARRIDFDRSKLIETLVERYNRSREIVEREVCEYCDGPTEAARKEDTEL